MQTRDRASWARRAAAIALRVGCGLVLLASGACSGSGGGDSRVGREPEATSTTRAPLIPPDAYDSLRNAQDPNSIMQAFGALGAAGQAVGPEALAAVAIGPVAMDFLGLVTRVQQSDYSVAYRLRGETISGLPGDTFVTIVQSGDRQKIAVRSGSVEVAQFRDGRDVVSCTRVAEWECEQAPLASGKAVGAESLLYFLGLVVEQPGAFDTRTYRTDIVGVPVNCIRSEPVQQAADLGLVEVCVTAEGVPLRGVLPDLTLDGVWYAPGADPADLSPPAPVRG